MKQITFSTYGFEIGDKVEFRPQENRRKMLKGVIDEFEVDAKYSSIGQHIVFVWCWITSEDGGLRYKKSVRQPSLKKI